MLPEEFFQTLELEPIGRWVPASREDGKRVFCACHHPKFVDICRIIGLKN